MKNNIDYSSRFRILKGGKISLVVSALLTSISLQASPTGGVVNSGNANINSNGTTTTITQSSNKASINWQSFSIASNETVNFVQPSSSSVTLNRVIGNSASIIAGHMTANGQVFLLNPNGIIFTKGSQVNVGALVASTLNMSDTDFNNANYVLSGTSTNSVINQGDITTANGGYVVFASKSVTNEGTITSPEGNIQLASGSQVSLNINGNSLLSLTIDKGTYDALVSNKGIIQANGGSVYLTSKAMDSVLNGVVNNSGVIQAHSIGTKDGKIVLFAHGGTMNAGGTLDTGAGTGFIETSGEVFNSDDTLHVTTGEWLIDPVDLTIDSTLASTISTTLNGGADVTESATNDITVSAPISWNSNTLTLSAGNNININAQLDLTSTAGLFLQYAQSTSTGTYNVYAPINIASTGSFSTQHASDAVVNYTIISDATALQNINSGLSGKYVLGTNIDASGIANFTPIGNSSTNFTGIFDGLGHTINNLTINRPTTDFVGLFGYNTGTIKNVGVTNSNITGAYYVGSLAGITNLGGAVSNSYTTGSVTGSSRVGGLVGSNYFCTLINSYATNSVSGTGDYVGGLIGYNNASTVSKSYATGSVTGTGASAGGFVGGFVGWNSNSTVTNSYATGSVTGSNAVGGFVGSNSNGTISNSYATGSVTGSGAVGGLVGTSYIGTISNSYATGSVSGTNSVGGLVGYNNGGTVNNSYWNTTTSGQSISAGGIGLTTAQMQDINSFSAWGSNIVTDDSLLKGYPQLRWATSGAAAGTSVWVLGTKVIASASTSTTDTSFLSSIMNGESAQTGSDGLKKKDAPAIPTSELLASKPFQYFYLGNILVQNYMPLSSSLQLQMKNGHFVIAQK